jgi:2-polyprenyl-3-methyl-5-hydroxy-6-metoxy-1,4-benzoquinol methylase
MNKDTQQEARMGNGYTTLDPRRRDGDPFSGTVIFNRLNPPIDPLTERARATWTAGDYDRISTGFRRDASAFVERLSLTSEHNVLDAACGTGNLTIPAARTGARVTGFDLVSSLLDAAAKWAAREGLEVRLDQGTVEAMPYADAEFDVVLSMFGAMFAPRPARVLAELARVTRPGGRVALANWTRQGFIGRLLATHVAYVPLPAGISSPLLWGDESVIRERFDPSVWDVSTTVRTLTFRYLNTPAGTADLFRTSYGPTVRTFEALGTERRGLLEADLVDLWELYQKPGAEGTEVDSEYLEVIAVRR